ncbi:MAG: alpha-amylase family glycosyl hydrolase [Oscillospiraceae bacterium]
MWAYESVFYQIYPLGLCGAPPENDGEVVNRIQKIRAFIPQLCSIHANAVYFSPVFESDHHGYDTRDFSKIDCRLGTNADFAELTGELHKNNIRVVLDGVFNHVGRGFWAFQDVLKNREASSYLDWFQVNLQGNNGYNDGLWYEGWEGHYELVKLNLQNPHVVDHILECVEAWIDEFQIDGLRLDVAYMLNEDFIRRLRKFCDGKKQDFFLVGEMIHGDYNRLLGSDMLHSVTNYECYKGLYSAFNTNNLFEVGHSLARQFGPENWTLYKEKHLFSFVDNHDVTRIATLLQDENQLIPLYGTLFGMPGIPCIYYGSEWGEKGDKNQGDAALRPALEKPESNALTEFIAKCSQAKRASRALNFGTYKNLVLQNKHMIFERTFENERVLVAINGSSEEVVVHFNANAGRARDLITGAVHDFGGGSVLAPYSACFWEIY